MILVTGATGTVGRELVRLLVQKGEPVRALVRSPEKACQLHAPGLELVLGDLADPKSLHKAIRGIGRVFLLTPSSPEQVQLESNLIAAAQSAEVNYIVKLSTLSAREDSDISICRWHGQAEELIRQSGIPYAFLRPQNFMQNLFTFAPSIRQNGIIRASMKKGRMSLVDARDVAEVAAKLLSGFGPKDSWRRIQSEGLLAEDSGFGGEKSPDPISIYRITGPESLSFPDIAARLGQVLGREIAYQDISEEQARQEMLEQGLAHGLIEDQIKIYRHFSTQQNPLITDTIAQVAQKEPYTLEQFVSDHRQAFL